MSHRTWGEHEEIIPTTWGTDWDNYSTANHCVIKKPP